MKKFVVGMVSALFFLWINITCWGGEYFDSKCIKGKLTTQHVRAINNVGWGKNSVEVDDRIINHKCSEVLRAIHFRN